MAESLSRRQADFTHAFARLVLYAESLGLKVKVQEWNRLESTQKEYVAAGKSKTMDSRHLDRLAVDLVLVLPDGQVLTSGEQFKTLGLYWEGLGGRWGGRFGLEHLTKADQDRKLGWDSPHFEFRRNA